MAQPKVQQPDRSAPTQRCLSDFEGRWRIHRLITPRDGQPARFEGEAVWAKAEGGLNYVEQGIMTLEGCAPMQAERRYFWADDLSVFFEDGRFFHTVPPAGGDVRHWCAPDDYQLIYDFSAWPAFSVHWEVRGPRKDYTARTEYNRC